MYETFPVLLAVFGECPPDLCEGESPFSQFHQDALILTMPPAYFPCRQLNSRIDSLFIREPPLDRLGHNLTRHPMLG